VRPDVSLGGEDYASGGARDATAGRIGAEGIPASAMRGRGAATIVPKSGPSGTRTPLSSAAPPGITPVTRITAMQATAMRRRVVIT
jgi:hypothetical protein